MLPHTGLGLPNRVIAPPPSSLIYVLGGPIASENAVLHASSAAILTSLVMLGWFYFFCAGVGCPPSGDLVCLPFAQAQLHPKKLVFKNTSRIIVKSIRWGKFQEANS